MYQRRNRLPIWYTRQAHTQATAHWNSATHAAPQPERISRLTAAMAATQGEYSSVNVKKLNAASGEKMAPSASPRVGDRGARQHGHGADDCLLCGKAVMSAVEARSR